MNLPLLGALLTSRRRGPLAVALATVALAGSIVAIEKWPRPARAAASLQIHPPRLAPGPEGVLPGLEAPRPHASALAASDPVLELAAVRLGDPWFPGVASGPDTLPSPEGEPLKVNRARVAAAVEELRARVSVEGEGETASVIATAKSADAARELADAVATSFASWCAGDVKARTKEMLEVLKARQQATLARLVEVEASLAKVRPPGVPQELIELSRPDLPSAMARLAELEARLSDAEADLKDLSAKINDPNYTFPVDVDEDAQVRALMAEVLRAQGRVGELQAKHGTSNHPEVKEAQAQATGWNNQLVEARSKAVSSLSAKARTKAIDQIRTLSEKRDSYRSEYDNLDARLKAERGAWEEKIQARLKALESANSPEVASLVAEATALDQYLMKIVSVRLAAEFEGGARALPVTVRPARNIAPARWPREWSWPLALAGSALFGFLASRLSRPKGPGIRTERQLQKALHIPVLGTTPKAPAPQRILLYVDPRHPFSEAFNTLAALIESYAADHAARTFLVTSATAGDGKSTVVSNLGISLARSGQRVILIDCDMRKGKLHEIFGTPNDRGVSEAGWDASGQPAIVEVDSLLKDTSEVGLRLIPCGPPAANPVALLKGTAFKGLLAETQQKADFIFIDAPPVTQVVDALLLTPIVEGVIFIAAAGESKVEDVAYAKRLLDNTHGRFAGAILTKATAEARDSYVKSPAEETRPA